MVITRMMSVEYCCNDQHDVIWMQVTHWFICMYVHRVGLGGTGNFYWWLLREGDWR